MHSYKWFDNLSYRLTCSYTTLINLLNGACRIYAWTSTIFIIFAPKFWKCFTLKIKIIWEKIVGLLYGIWKNTTSTRDRWKNRRWNWIWARKIIRMQTKDAYVSLEVWNILLWFFPLSVSYPHKFKEDIRKPKSLPLFMCHRSCCMLYLQ